MELAQPKTASSTWFRDMHLPSAIRRARIDGPVSPEHSTSLKLTYLVITVTIINNLDYIKKYAPLLLTEIASYSYSFFF